MFKVDNKDIRTFIYCPGVFIVNFEHISHLFLVSLLLLWAGKCLHAYQGTAFQVSKYGVFSGPYFPAFGMNTEKYGVSLCIQSKCRKIRTRKTPNTDIFQAVELVWPKKQHHLKSWVKLKALIQRNFWVLFKTYVFKSIFKIKLNSNHFL